MAGNIERPLAITTRRSFRQNPAAANVFPIFEAKNVKMFFNMTKTEDEAEAFEGDQGLVILMILRLF